MSSIFDSHPLRQEPDFDWSAALQDARINAGIDRLSRHQKLMLIEMLVNGRRDLRYQTYNALQKLGFVHDRLNTSEYWGWMWDAPTADGIVAALRLLDPEYKDGSLFYQLRRQRVIKENAQQALAADRRQS